MTEPNYSPSLLDATREALVQVGIIRPADSPLDDDYLVDADLIELLDALRGRGWIVEPDKLSIVDGPLGVTRTIPR